MFLWGLLASSSSGRDSVSLERGSLVDLFVSLPPGLACLLLLLLEVSVFQEQTPHWRSSMGSSANS